MCEMRAATFAARKDLPEMERATTRAAHFLKHTAALGVLGVGPSPWREVPASHDMWQERDREAKMG